MNQLVSIIIPVYNDPNLKTALESCLKQTYSPIEILVIDDGSDLDIQAAIRELQDNRIKYFRQTNNGNADICRNIGIKQAQGHYVCFLDSDDLYLKDHISTCVEIMEKEKADGLYGSTIVHNGYSAFQVFADFPQEDETLVNYLIRKGYGACTSSLFMTRASALNIQWDETLKRHQDYDFLVRYNKKYSLTVKKQVGCICNAAPNRKEKKSIDFNSCIRFSDNHKDDIRPGFYYSYITHMLNLARESQAEQHIIEYYENELQKTKQKEKELQNNNQ